jgi:hypothetical protein
MLCSLDTGGRSHGNPIDIVRSVWRVDQVYRPRVEPRSGESLGEGGEVRGLPLGYGCDAGIGIHVDLTLPVHGCVAEEWIPKRIHRGDSARSRRRRETDDTILCRGYRFSAS